MTTETLNQAREINAEIMQINTLLNTHVLTIAGTNIYQSYKISSYIANQEKFFASLIQLLKNRKNELEEELKSL